MTTGKQSVWKRASNHVNLHWHPSQNRRALDAFIRYAEARVEHAPLDEKSARAALAWLRGLYTI